MNDHDAYLNLRAQNHELEAELNALRARLVWASNNEQLIKQLNTNCAAKDAELAQLRTKLAEVEQQRDGWWKENEALEEQNTILHRQLIEADQNRINIEKIAGERWTKLKAEADDEILKLKVERDFAYIRGLGRAYEIANAVNLTSIGSSDQSRWIILKCIQDEIDKIGKK